MLLKTKLVCMDALKVSVQSPSVISCNDCRNQDLETGTKYFSCGKETLVSSSTERLFFGYRSRLCSLPKIICNPFTSSKLFHVIHIQIHTHGSVTLKGKIGSISGKGNFAEVPAVNVSCCRGKPCGKQAPWNSIFCQGCKSFFDSNV